VEAGQDAAEAARAEFYPNVDLTGFVGLQSLGLDQLAKGGSRILGVGPAIHLPVFDQGRLRARLAERFAEQDAAIAQYNQALVTALREVADPLAQWRAAHAETQVRHTALEAQQQAQSLARQRQQAGLSSQLPVLNAQTPILLQQRQLAELRSRQLEASAALNTALGGGYSPASTELTSH
jgi:outer membrane protein TolC